MVHRGRILNGTFRHDQCARRLTGPALTRESSTLLIALAAHAPHPMTAGDRFFDFLPGRSMPQVRCQELDRVETVRPEGRGVVKDERTPQIYVPLALAADRLWEGPESDFLGPSDWTPGFW